MIGFATYGMLYPPQIALRAQTSVRGFTISSFYKFGNVNAVNYACITTNIGASVLFKVDDAVLVTAPHNGDYYIIDEDKIIFKENQ
jgi:hypothetical protein